MNYTYTMDKCGFSSDLYMPKRIWTSKINGRTTVELLSKKYVNKKRAIKIIESYQKESEKSSTL